MSDSYYDALEQLFRAADADLRVNTAYPVFKEGFARYESPEDLFCGVEELSFYIHIPFCRQLCSFCEYTRFAADDADEERYLDLLERQTEEFLAEHGGHIKKLYGLDIGGGTPTALSDAAFHRLMELQKRLCTRFAKVTGFRKSIEGTFATLSDAKPEMIAQYGFRRLSVGLQSTNASILRENGRSTETEDEMLHVRQKAADAGVRRFNIDVMYGLPHLTDEDIRETAKTLCRLAPEEVTLYETRFNRTRADAAGITRETQYRQYSIYYELLTAAGYHGRFGRNTFTRCRGEIGVSDYLKYRMTYNIPYKGFGVSAQSMSGRGLSYGSLKNSASRKLPPIGRICEEHNYRLPPEELAAKYVSIAMYAGEFRLDVLRNILGRDPFETYLEPMDYLFENGFVTQVGDVLRLTEKGFRYYGAISSLFWSRGQQERLLQDRT